MSDPSSAPPRRTRYLLWSLPALLVLIPTCAYLSGWALAWWQPTLIESDEIVRKLLIWSVLAPMIAVTAIASWRWSVAQSRSSSPDPAPAAAAAPLHESERPDYVLEVIGLGVTFDKYRQGRLWDALRQGHPQSSIREQDPKKYPWGASEKKGIEGKRTGDTLENGAKRTAMYWGVPTFAADFGENPKRPTSTINTFTGVAGEADSSGMAFHLFVSAGWKLAEHPDRLMDDVFRFFDEHPDVPYVVVSGADGMYFRYLYSAEDTPPLITDGYYIPPMPDSSALFVLARRDRVDRLRPFAFDDLDEEKYLGEELNRRSPARKLGVAYLALSRMVPKPKGYIRRIPTVAEWLQATKAFAQRSDIYPQGISNAFPELLHRDPKIPTTFKPTPWFPIPWNKYQLATFDQLPTLGFVHRPVFVPMTAPDGHPLTRRDEREAALAAGFQRALQTLPEAERKAAPARVIAATGGNTDQTIALASVLNGWSTQGGPELDRTQPTRWIDTDARLGNTGAATWFMQMAIGVIGSYREGGASAAINLRDPAEASIIFVTPPSEEKRKAQQSATGGDVWGSAVSLAVDPANYGR